MKIIFLDIDGVLCLPYNWGNPWSYKDTYLMHFNKECVKWLNLLTDRTGAKFVISSTWRNKGLDILVEHFKNEGITGEIISFTPKSGGQRGNEIKHWLDEEKDYLNRVTNFVVLDDDSDMDAVKDNFVLVAENLAKTEEVEKKGKKFIITKCEGLTEEHIIKAEEILNRG